MELFPPTGPVPTDEENLTAFSPNATEGDGNGTFTVGDTVGDMLSGSLPCFSCESLQAARFHVAHVLFLLSFAAPNNRYGQVLR